MKSILILLFISAPILAVEKKVEEHIRGKLELSLEIHIESIQKSPIKNLYTLVTDKGILYYDVDGDYVIQGTIYNVNQGFKDETDAVMGQYRTQDIADLRSTFISYKAENEQFQVTVFTDITCGYCRKLHKEMADYHQAGITINYIAYPRGGLGSQAHKSLESVWCAEDPTVAMHDAKIKQKIIDKTCSSPVAQHYALGNKFGLNGTPAIVLEDGSMLGGYVSAAKLLEILNKKTLQK